MDDRTTRELIRTASGQIPVRPPDPAQLIAGAGHASRPSRWVLGAVAAVVVVLTATALIGVLVGPHGGSDGDRDPATRQTPSSTAVPRSVAAWVRGLPPGDSPLLPYFKGREFVDGSERVALPGYPYTILGGAPHGLLVRQDRPGYDFRYGVVHGDASVTWLTASASDPLETVSKDHRQLAVATDRTIQLFDLGQERVTATFHAGSSIYGLRSLTDRGLVFDTETTDGTGTADLWSPGHPVLVLPFAPFAASTDLRYALVVERGEPCADAVRILPDDTTAVVYHGCGTARPLSLSPDGLHAMTPDLRIVDLRNASLLAVNGTGARSASPETSYGDHEMVWEDDAHVLVRLSTSGRQDGPGATALIRCSTQGACERVFTDVPRHPSAAYAGIQILDPTTQPYG